MFTIKSWLEIQIAYKNEITFLFTCLEMVITTNT